MRQEGALTDCVFGKLELWVLLCLGRLYISTPAMFIPLALHDLFVINTRVCLPQTYAYWWVPH